MFHRAFLKGEVLMYSPVSIEHVYDQASYLFFRDLKPENILLDDNGES